MKAERPKKKRKKKNSLALSASVIWASTVYHNAINLRSAPSSCVVMNWAMSLTPEQQRWVCQVNEQVQDVVKPCFQRQQQHCQLGPWDTFSSPQAVLSAAAFTSVCFQDSVHSLPPNHLKRFHGILGAYKTMPKGRSTVNVGWRTGDRTRSAGCQFIGKKSTRLPRWNGSQIWILQLMNNCGEIYVKIACKLSSMPDID